MNWRAQSTLAIQAIVVFNQTSKLKLKGVVMENIFNPFHSKVFFESISVLLQLKINLRLAFLLRSSQVEFDSYQFYEICNHAKKFFIQNRLKFQVLLITLRQTETESKANFSCTS